jgi:hypothetical protein
MISDKMKALLKLTGKREVELAAEYGISPQGMHNKFSRGSFSMEDAIKIGAVTGATLSYTLPDGQRITFDSSDIREK